MIWATIVTSILNTLLFLNAQDMHSSRLTRSPIIKITETRMYIPTLLKVFCDKNQVRRLPVSGGYLSRHTVEARKLEHHYPDALKVKYKGS